MPGFITPTFRASYANVWKPKETQSGALKYSISMIFDPSDPETAKGIDGIKAQIRKAIVSKWGPDEKKWPRNLKLPLRDASQEDRGNSESDQYDPVYKDKLFMNAGSDRAPGIVKIVDGRLESIVNEMEFYSGCYAKASINFFAFDKAGNKGVGVGLNNLLFERDGERLGGPAPAEEDFASFASGDSSSDESLFT